MAGTGRWCGRWPPTCRSSCCPTAATRPTTPPASPPASAGLSVKRTASPAAIAAAVRRVLDDPALRSGAARLGVSIRRDAASGALVDELEDLPAAVPA